MDRMSSLDAEFLHLEDERSPMHIGGVCVFDGTAPAVEELRASLDARLDDVPRYRQRIGSIPLGLGRPVWIDDDRFDIAHHVHVVALPRPAGEDELSDLVGRLMSTPLDRDRPLWELWMVERLAGDRWALVCKVHHCVVDGIAGVALLRAVLDVDPHATQPTASRWEPAPEPSVVHRVTDAWLGLGADLGEWLRRLAHVPLRPIASARAAADLTGGLVRLLGGLAPTTPSPLEGHIGAHRVWRHVSVELADIGTARRRVGATVNDVAVAVVAWGYRELLLSRGVDPTTVQVRAAIPTSVRHDDQIGNRVATMLIDLPVGLDDPADMLDAVRASLSASKKSHMVEAADELVHLVDLAPPMIVQSFSRLATRLEHHVTQRFVTTVVTNVPGPQFPLYCLGREMLEYRPYLGLSQGARVTTAILSYNGHVCFGVTGDEDSAADVDVITRGIPAALSALRRRRRPQAAGG